MHGPITLCCDRHLSIEARNGAFSNIDLPAVVPKAKVLQPILALRPSQVLKGLVFSRAREFDNACLGRFYLKRLPVVLDLICCKRSRSRSLRIAAWKDQQNVV